ncbi:MAG TPA: family 16 glycosylhydrolase, partial [Oceanipulchritudo sp.]|nr:family 16 glycosylhydrolase [Oceanipulchritudo sp.]
EISQWGTYRDENADGQADYHHLAGAVEDLESGDLHHILISNSLHPAALTLPADSRSRMIASDLSSEPAARLRLLLDPYIPDDGLLSIATFNIEWLGHPQMSRTWHASRESQLDLAAEEIIEMEADIVALQEIIVDPLNGNALTDLLDRLNRLEQGETWSGLYSDRFSFWWNPDFNNFPGQRQAFVWRTSVAHYVTATTLLRSLPEGDSRFASGRLPLMLHLEVGAGAVRTPLYLVNLHLKCCRGSDGRRHESMTLLVNELRNLHADKPLIVLGDFNVADRGGANGEIAEWEIYEDADGDGVADFFHVAGAVEDEAWDDIDHILFSNELDSLYQAAPVESRNLRIPSLVSDHDPIMIRLSWEPTEEFLDAIWKRDNPGEYALVWSDEFEQPDGSFPDRANWVHEVGGWGWGNEEEQYYTSSTDNVRIENGHLVLELREDSANQYPENDYTSGRIRTKDRHAWTHGRMEARIRLPYGGGSGLWPAFWMLGSDIDTVGWPACGEIDIMEYISRKPNEIFGTIHGPGYAGGASFGSIHEAGGPVAPPAPPALNDPYDPQYFNLYAVEWEPDQIRWYFDDLLYHEAKPSDIAPNEWVFDHDHFILLNLAIGGNFGGQIEAGDLVFPTRMLVDYVRVYQLEDPDSLEEDPQLSLSISSTLNDLNGDGFADVGESISYAYILENTGSTKLHSVSITDPPVTITPFPVESPNLLTNSGFDLGNTTGWTTGSTIANLPAESGGHALRISASGGFSSPAAFQSLPAVSGEEFKLSGYIYTAEPLPSSGNFGLFKIVFKDSSGSDLVPASSSSGQINTDFPGAESLPFLDASQPVGDWIYSEAQAVAPAGTASVNFYALNIDQSPATLFFDSLEAVALSTPESLRLDPGQRDHSTFSSTSILSEADLNAGFLHSSALATSDETAPAEAELITYLPLDPGLDTDGDGITNLFERAFGLDMFTPDPPSRAPRVSIDYASGPSPLRLTYRRRVGGSGSTGFDYTKDGLTYRVRVSHDLLTWDNGASAVEQVGATVNNGDGTETVTVRPSAAPGEGHQFIRLEVQGPTNPVSVEGAGRNQLKM